MKLPRRQFLHLAAGAAALPAMSRFAWTQAYPSRQVHIIAGFAAGGGVDITARLIGRWLSERLGQSFVIENRPGADGNIGTEVVVNAPPDGHTLLLATVPNAVNATLYQNLNWALPYPRTPLPRSGLVQRGFRDPYPTLLAGKCSSQAIRAPVRIARLCSLTDRRIP